MRFKFLSLFAAVILVAACETAPENSGASSGTGGGTTTTTSTATTTTVQPQGPAPGSQEDLVVNIGDRVFFDFDKYNLKPAGRARLDKLVVDLRRVKSVSSIEIVGHTDSKGTEAYNYQLGHRRADTVANYLAAQGVPSSIISTSSRGELDPVAPNTLPNGKDNPAGRALNRRVVITVTAMEKVISQ